MTAIVFWIAVAAMTVLAALIIAKDRRDRGAPIDWDAPASDLRDADDVYDSARTMLDRAPVVWSDAVPPGGWVCAAPAAHLPDGICGWAADDPKGCPQHGQLLLPGGER